MPANAFDLRVCKRLHDLHAQHAMCFHAPELSAVQPSRIQPHRVRNADLTDIVQLSSQIDFATILRAKP